MFDLPRHMATGQQHYAFYKWWEKIVIDRFLLFHITIAYGLVLLWIFQIYNYVEKDVFDAINIHQRSCVEQHSVNFIDQVYNFVVLQLPIN